VKVGDRVTTPDGAGVIVGFWVDRGLNAGQPYHHAWIQVRLDDGRLRDITAGQAVAA
jgi:hypothetical protein